MGLNHVKIPRNHSRDLHLCSKLGKNIVAGIHLVLEVLHLLVQTAGEVRATIFCRMFE